LKILLCFGTRPEAIKMAPIIKELDRQHISYKVCVTAQHREMLDQVLDFFEIIPNYDLSLMKSGQSLNSLSASILNSIDSVLDDYKPDVVLVQGDTTTAAMVALGSFHRNIKIGHIEAGLRTYNKRSPFPEEANRQLISKLADFHFAPTSDSKTNLVNEMVDAKDILITGNTVVDALKWAIKKIDDQESEEIIRVKDLINEKKKMILVTGHRRENFGTGLKNICEALVNLSRLENIQIIYLLHLNPNVSGPVKEILGKVKNISLIPPVAYPTMIFLMQKCDLIISDSGGIQEEAPSFNKQVLVTRNHTERMEGIKGEFCFLVGTNSSGIFEKTKEVLTNPTNNFDKVNPYGDGFASQKIIEFLKIK
jgi:UDP-N-acetylglucosamine 2-epimerase (non-hydrolysing)